MKIETRLVSGIQKKASYVLHGAPFRTERWKENSSRHGSKRRKTGKTLTRGDRQTGGLLAGKRHPGGATKGPKRGTP